ILLQNSSEFNDYLRSLPSYYNPVYISTLIFIIVVAVIYISYKYIYNPMIKKHRKDKKQFEITTEKILSMFSELDPNPIIRINKSGIVINLNDSAKKRFTYLKINESSIKNIIPNTELNINEIIENDKTFIQPIEINDRFYDINFHGISFLGMAQLYFWDTTAQKEYDRQMTNYQNLLRNSSAHLQKVIKEERNILSRI